MNGLILADEGDCARSSASSTLTLKVNISPAAVPSCSNTASVTTAGDANAANNSATDIAAVLTSPTQRTFYFPHKLILPILLSLGIACSCGRSGELAVPPRQVCEVIDRIQELEGEQLVVYGILHWSDRDSWQSLTDCRLTDCQKWLTIEMRSDSEDPSVERLIHAIRNDPFHVMIVTLEGTVHELTWEDPFVRPELSPTMVLRVSKVKSMEPVRVDGTKRSNYCY